MEEYVSPLRELPAREHEMRCPPSVAYFFFASPNLIRKKTIPRKSIACAPESETHSASQYFLPAEENVHTSKLRVGSDIRGASKYPRESDPENPVAAPPAPDAQSAATFAN